VRIAHIGSKGIPSKGGTERVVEAVAARQAREHQVTVYGSARVCSTGMHRGVRVLAIPAPAAKHLGPVILQLRAVLLALLCERYDVVHVHASENGFVVPLLRLRYPVVTTNHGPAYEREKWGAVARRLIRANERFSVRSATIATAVAGNQAEQLSKRHGRRVVHVPNGVDPHEPVATDEALALLGEHGLDRDGYVLFAAARVDPTKGCHTLLEACHQLETPPPVLVIGDLGHAPGYEEELRGLAQGLRVCFVPRLDDKSVLMALLQDCRVFVFPSTVEAMSMMLLEALAVGTVGLVSDIPENTTILPENYPTFGAGDAADLRRRLESVLAWDDDQRRSVKNEGAEWVHARYDWVRIAAQYEELYDRALRSRSTR
jgi:glycosyltransferase involved in cell wall biosynthesis